MRYSPNMQAPAGIAEEAVMSPIVQAPAGITEEAVVSQYYSQQQPKTPNG